MTKWRRLAVSHNWRQGLWGKWSTVSGDYDWEGEEQWEWDWVWTNWLGFVVSPQSSVVVCHGPKFNFMPRDTKTKAGRNDRQSTVFPVIPSLQWAQHRQVDIQKCAHFAQKNFKLATFAKQLIKGRQIKNVRATSLSPNGMVFTVALWMNAHSGGIDTPDDNLKSSVEYWAK